MVVDVVVAARFLRFFVWGFYYEWCIFCVFVNWTEKLGELDFLSLFLGISSLSLCLYLSLSFLPFFTIYLPTSFLLYLSIFLPLLHYLTIYFPPSLSSLSPSFSFLLSITPSLIHSIFPSFPSLRPSPRPALAPRTEKAAGSSWEPQRPVLWL